MVSLKNATLRGIVDVLPRKERSEMVSFALLDGRLLPCLLLNALRIEPISVFMPGVSAELDLITASFPNSASSCVRSNWASSAMGEVGAITSTKA